MSSATVVGYLFRIMKKAGLNSSGYWLRHTYAQNLLQIGRPIYEVKEMLGHDDIDSTGVYLHIHTIIEGMIAPCISRGPSLKKTD
jgi:site-specific recombinase XerD